MPRARYSSLKDFVAKRGGLRLAVNGGLRDQLVELAVADFPLDAPDDKVVEVLAARLRIRARERYGSVMALILVSILANLIARLVWEWWRKAHSHRVLMHGWQANAKEG